MVEEIEFVGDVLVMEEGVWYCWVLDKLWFINYGFSIVYGEGLYCL